MIIYLEIYHKCVNKKIVAMTNRMRRMYITAFDFGGGGTYPSRFPMKYF